MRKRICSTLFTIMILCFGISNLVLANDTEEDRTINAPIIISGDEVPLLDLKNGDGYLDKYFEDSYWFAIPDNGHATITAKVWYTEYYTPEGINCTFKERTRAVVFRRETMSFLPEVTMHNVSHSNGAIFNTWTQQSMWVDGSEWQGGRMDLNTDAITHSKSTSIYGTLPFTVSCEGAILPVRSESIKLPLKVV